MALGAARAVRGLPCDRLNPYTVSYTHLDVYKRQDKDHSGRATGRAEQSYLRLYVASRLDPGKKDGRGTQRIIKVLRALSLIHI